MTPAVSPEDVSFACGDTESFVESDALTEAYGATGQVVHHDH